MRPSRKKILGIYREEIYSNHAVEADHAIIDEALDEIEKQADTEIEIIRAYPHRLTAVKGPFSLILTMAQGAHALQWVAEQEKVGAPTINSTRAIQNCFRVNLMNRLGEKVFSHPRSEILDPAMTLERLPFEARHGYWVKRGDFHALSDEDVMYARTLSEINAGLGLAKARSVKSVVLQEHIPGQIFKFYGVKNSFFNLRPMQGPFRNEDLFQNKVNLDQERLEQLAHQAAERLELDFFGGDCVATESGSIHLIDVNDWPSFRTCRMEAAAKMGEYALRKLRSL